MSIPREQRGNIYQQLPKKLQSFFTNRELTEHLIQLGDTYGLSKKDRNTLGEEVGLTILGINKLNNLNEQLKDKLDVHYDSAEKIAKSVEKQIPGDIKKAINDLPKPKALLKNAENVGQTGDDDIPVPPPPGSDTDAPTPHYGGDSDPYREPSE